MLRFAIYLTLYLVLFWISFSNDGPYPLIINPSWTKSKIRDWNKDFKHKKIRKNHEKMFIKMLKIVFLMVDLDNLSKSLILDATNCFDGSLISSNYQIRTN